MEVAGFSETLIISYKTTLLLHATQQIGSRGNALACILEAPGSNFSWDTDYSLRLLVVLLSLSRRMLG
jgi:hypothetical protein